MGGGITSFANLVLRQKQLQEMTKMRQLQEKNIQEPRGTTRIRMGANQEALSLMGPSMMATKKLLIDEKRDPHFRRKLWWARKVYEQGIAKGENPGWFPNVEQQIFYKVPQDDETTMDALRYFGITGQLYATAAPALQQVSGSRAQSTLKMLSPHIPDFAMVPQQIWERLQNIYPRLKQEFGRDVADPLYGNWVKGQVQAGKKADTWRSRFTDEEFNELSSGVYGDTRGKLPASAMAVYKDGNIQYYRDLASGKRIELPARALSTLKTSDLAPPGTLVIPSRALPSTLPPTSIIPSRSGGGSLSGP